MRCTSRTNKKQCQKGCRTQEVESFKNECDVRGNAPATNEVAYAELTVNQGALSFWKKKQRGLRTALSRENELFCCSSFILRRKHAILG